MNILILITIWFAIYLLLKLKKQQEEIMAQIDEILTLLDQLEVAVDGAINKIAELKENIITDTQFNIIKTRVQGAVTGLTNIIQ